LGRALGRAEERPDPDRVLRVAAPELDPDPGREMALVVLRHRGHPEIPEILGAAAGEAGLRPAAHHLGAEHLGHEGAEPAALLRILVVDDEALVFAVVAPLDPLEQALQHLALFHGATTLPEARTWTRRPFAWTWLAGEPWVSWKGSLPVSPTPLRTALKSCL